MSDCLRLQWSASLCLQLIGIAINKTAAAAESSAAAAGGLGVGGVDLLKVVGLNLAEAGGRTASSGEEAPVINASGRRWLSSPPPASLNEASRRIGAEGEPRTTLDHAVTK